MGGGRIFANSSKLDIEIMSIFQINLISPLSETDSILGTGGSTFSVTGITIGFSFTAPLSKFIFTYTSLLTYAVY
jgi:hypothetical protein